MPDEKIADLIERVERAKGPDRDIDRDIGLHVAGLTFNDKMPWNWIGPGVDVTGALPSYTASLDAVLSLVERVRPGWDWRNGDEKQNGLGTWLRVYSKAATPPLAVLSALLRSITGVRA